MRILGIAVAIVSVLGVAGCSEAGTSADQPSTTTTSTSAASLPECVAVADAKAAISGDTGAHLDTASDALATAQDALAARPVNLVALRDSLSTALTALTALTDALRVCAPGSTIAESITVPAPTS